MVSTATYVSNIPVKVGLKNSHAQNLQLVELQNVQTLTPGMQPMKLLR